MPRVLVYGRWRLLLLSAAMRPSPIFREIQFTSLDFSAILILSVHVSSFVQTTADFARTILSFLFLSSGLSSKVRTSK